MTCLSLTLIPVRINADTPVEPSAVTNNNTKEAAEVKTLELRLYEIKAMDLSKLKSSEKKALRKEVRTIKHRLHDIGGGVYVSAGAIIVVLVLILLLV